MSASARLTPTTFYREIDRNRRRSWLLVAAVIFVLGVQGFVLALVGEYLGRIQREVEGRPLYAIEREL